MFKEVLMGFDPKLKHVNSFTDVGTGTGTPSEAAKPIFAGDYLLDKLGLMHDGGDQ